MNFVRVYSLLHINMIKEQFGTLLRSTFYRIKSTKMNELNHRLYITIFWHCFYCNNHFLSLPVYDLSALTPTHFIFTTLPAVIAKFHWSINMCPIHNWIENTTRRKYWPHAVCHLFLSHFTKKKMAGIIRDPLYLLRVCPFFHSARVQTIKL